MYTYEAKKVDLYSNKVSTTEVITNENCERKSKALVK